MLILRGYRPTVVEKLVGAIVGALVAVIPPCPPAPPSLPPVRSRVEVTWVHRILAAARPPLKQGLSLMRWSPTSNPPPTATKCHTATLGCLVEAWSTPTMEGM